MVGLTRAAALHWTCDDAFISLRYADNLIAGHGLVWNPGERVEGMTNLAWTLALALGRAAGLDARLLAEGLGLACYALLLGLVWRWERRRYPDGAPLAFLALALLPDLHLWATGGLETMGATLAAAAQVTAILGGRRWLGGALAALAWLLRPDAALVAGVVALTDAAEALPDWRRALRRLVAGALPLALAIAALTAFRLAYYGDPVPNTFYAKSAEVGWWSQGLVYLALAAITSSGVVVALVCAILWVRRADRTHRVLALGLLVAFGLHALYVARSGGDFMHVRRLVPAIPLVLIAARLLLPSGLERNPTLLALWILVCAVPVPLYERFGEGGRVAGVADERAFYPAEVMDHRIVQGQALGEALTGLHAPLLIEGGLCVLAWASGLPEIIEANGLTDRTIAHQSVVARGLAGHEKHPTEAYLDERQVAALVLHGRPRGSAGFDLARHPALDLHLLLRRHDPAITAALRAAGFQVPTLDEVRAFAREAARRAPCPVVKPLFGRLQAYLSPHPPEPELWAALTAYVEARCPPNP